MKRKLVNIQSSFGQKIRVRTPVSIGFPISEAV
jgi:hypothetical protein